MTKEKIANILYIISVLLVIAFFGFVIYDYINYNSIVSSAPFSAYILINALRFLFPCIILITIGNVLKRKNQ